MEHVIIYVWLWIIYNLWTHFL